MDDETTERLMGYLGLAYHRVTDDVTPNGEWRMCACGFAYIRPERHVNLTFDTPDDFFALKDKLVENTEEKYFIEFAKRKWKVDPVGCFTFWLLNPTRFCNLVGEWLKGRG